jgi:hypothetical protein
MAKRNKDPWGKLSIPEKAHPMVRELYKVANAERAKMKEMASKAGVPYGTIQNWRVNSIPTVSTLEAMFNVLGYELCIRKRETAG